MIDIYTALLRLVPNLDLLSFGGIDPGRMPCREEIERSLAIARQLASTDAAVADPVLRRVFMRMAAVNAMVIADAKLERCEPEALLVGAGPLGWEPPLSGPWAHSNSGEMICPECGEGSLCYLVGNESGAFVECSTVDCLYWDARR